MRFFRSIGNKLIPGYEKPDNNGKNYLFFGLEKPKTSEIEIGSGSALYIGGWCFHSEYTVKKIRIFIGSSDYMVNNFNLFRPDVFHHFREKGQIYDHSVSCGFWCIVPLKYQKDEILSLRLEVTLKNNAVFMKELGQIQVMTRDKNSMNLDKNKQEIEQRIEKTRSISPDPFVVICLATFNPDEELFRQQILSIKNQSYQNWLCIINDDCSQNNKYQFIRQTVEDDPRFIVSRNDKNTGFYHNFEKLLKMVPENCEYVALSDQDDSWYRDKIERLVNAFEPGISLVYSDMRIVDRSGLILSETFWTKRRNQYKDLDFLILANTITGAALMFRSRILPYLFPFPEEIGDAFHDNWIGSVSFLCGKIRYLDIPLYNYYQHTGNVIGHAEMPDVQSNVLGDIRYLVNRDNLERILNSDLDFYNTYGAKRQALAICLALRADLQKPDTDKPIKTFCHLDSSSLGFLFMMITAKIKKYSTLGFEQKLFIGYWIARLLRTGFLEHRLLAIIMKDPQKTTSPRGLYMYDFLLDHKLKPLSLHISRDEKMRINFLMEIFDFKYFFGGFFANFNLMKLLYKSGYSVRLILVDQGSLDINECNREIRKYEGLEDFFDHVSVEFALDRTKIITVSKNDVFIAASCWTAYLCHEAAHEVSGDENKRFIFLIQEYEPFFYPHGSMYAIMNDAYNLPHFAIFSTSFLKNFFRDNNTGVFNHKSNEDRDNNSTFYDHPVIRNTTDLIIKKKGRIKKFVFYTRPEEHAKRNLFDLGMLAIIKALDKKILEPDAWEFYGIGTISKDKYFPLIPGITMKILPKVSLNEYYDMLCDFDLGLALMYTPHPSIPPLDMAAAGNIVVTTACFGKTPDSLGKISDNLIAVEPRLDAIVEGISQGVIRVNDYQKRTENSNLNWPRSWDEAYNKEVRTKIIDFVKKIADDS